MKKKVVQLTNSLSLNKETITKLSEDQLDGLLGGQGAQLITTQSSCGAFSCNPDNCAAGPHEPSSEDN